jgi:P27 family predicted phage terminase small subunit
MGRRGPPPTPTAILLQRGSWRGKANKAEPKPEIGAERPEGLNKAAIAVWDQMAERLSATRVLTRDDAITLGRYCDALVRWRRAAAFLDQQKEDFYTIKDELGKVKSIKPWPAVAQYHKLGAMLLRIEQEFGLTPSSRSRIQVPSEPPKAQQAKSHRQSRLSRPRPSWTNTSASSRATIRARPATAGSTPTRRRERDRLHRGVLKLAKGTKDRRPAAVPAGALAEGDRRQPVRLEAPGRQPPVPGVLHLRGEEERQDAFVAAILLLVLMTDDEPARSSTAPPPSRDQAALIFDHAERHGPAGAGAGQPADRLRRQGRVAAEVDRLRGTGVVQVPQRRRQHGRRRQPALRRDRRGAPARGPGARRGPAEVDRGPAQPLVLYTTTADYNRPSLCNTMLKRARQVRDNKGDPDRLGYDPEFLPVVYEASKEDDYTDPATWRKANPNLGVTVTEDFLARECKKAQETPSELNNFLRLHLNIVTDADEAWLRMDRWQKCSGLREDETPEQWRVRKLAELRGRPCFLGMDLSARST